MLCCVIWYCIKLYSVLIARSLLNTCVMYKSEIWKRGSCHSQGVWPSVTILCLACLWLFYTVRVAILCLVFCDYHVCIMSVATLCRAYLAILCKACMWLTYPATPCKACVLLAYLAILCKASVWQAYIWLSCV